jgi:hypothetical protein
MNSTGIKLAVGALALCPLQAEQKLGEKKEKRDMRGISPKFVLYKIAPIDINETLWNNEANLLITCI